MAQTHTWNVDILAQTVIGEIDPTSVYYTGPFLPNTMQTLASLKIKNTGTKSGTVYWRLYEWPGVQGPPPQGCTIGCAVENLIKEGSVVLNPGQTSSPITVSNLTPETIWGEPPGQAFTWPLGVKVKGETEANWPTWGLGLRTSIFNGSVDTKIIIGLLAIGGLAALLWYTKKKKIW